MATSPSFFEVLKSELSIDIDTVPFKIFFTLVYGGLAGLTNFSSLYYTQLGLSPQEIGLVSAVRHTFSIVVLPLIGPVVDFKEYRRSLLVIFIVIFTCCITPIGFIQKPRWCCSQNETSNMSFARRYSFPPGCCSETDDNYCYQSVTSFGQPQIGYIVSDVFKAFIIICALNGLGDMCWMTIRVTSDVSLAQALGGNSDRYGTSKVFGAIGGALFALMAGYLIDRSTAEVKRCGTEFQQYNYSYIFVANAVLMALSAIIVLFFPKYNGNSQNTNRCPTFDWKECISSLLKFSYIKLYVISFLFGTLKASSLTAFAYIYLREVGGSNILVGAAATLGIVSGIVAGFCSSYLIRRFEHKLLYASFLITVLVMMIYSLLETNWLIIIASLLMGGTPIIEWNVCVFIMRKIVDDKQTGTAYSLMTLTTKIGKLISSVLAGYLYSIYGPTWLFRIFAAFSFVAVGITYISFRSISHEKNEGDNDTDSKTDAETEETSLLTATRPVAVLPDVSVDCDIQRVQPK
ncbi:uncharacterized MFS-type transporter YttB-like [Anneissia japonica]|uniref:uncharacterized MFS-type transporter YttB-like n=1 Tax=Anneissia japonica TaxID=1529436 RepID=UPI0014258477|nr:uncharacterized MFS-type transporter YttB-like [Anneissia japonica]